MRRYSQGPLEECITIERTQPAQSLPEPLAYDTSLTAEAQQIAHMRERSPCERMRLMFELSAFAMAASRAAIRRSHPHLNALEQARFLITLQFDAARAAQLQGVPYLENAMSIPSAMLPVIEALNVLHVPYFVSGSIASSAYSLPRTTYDVDLVAALQTNHIAPFVANLKNAYYVDAGAVLDAIIHQASFHMTHHATGINIDIFIPSDRPFDTSQFARTQSHLVLGTEQVVNVVSPEDLVLNKLAWYVLRNPVADQQWRDVQALLRVQGATLDEAYLQNWAADLGLSELLAAALRGHRPPPNAPPQQSL